MTTPVATDPTAGSVVLRDRAARDGNGRPGGGAQRRDDPVLALTVVDEHLGSQVVGAGELDGGTVVGVGERCAGGEHLCRSHGVAHRGLVPLRTLPLPDDIAPNATMRSRAVTDSPIHLGVASIRSTRPR